MALALEGFSVREYVANTRSSDLDKCWPFGGGGERSLPEISIRKFRFWANEIKAEELPPVRTSAMGKQRTPKKRSIIELFAAVPPIGSDGGAFDGIEENDEEIKGKGKVIDEKIMRKKLMKGKIQKRGKKRLSKVEICASKKEKRSKPTSSALIFHKLQDLKHKALSRKNSKNLVDSTTKSVYMKNLPKNRKLKLLQSSKQISKEKMEPGKVLQVHHILKYPTRGPTNKAGAKTNRGDNLVDSCHKSEEHVTFLGEGDTLAYAKSCSYIDNTCKVDDLPAANDMAQAEKSSDINASSDIVNRTDETSAGKEQIFESHINLLPPIYKYPKNRSCSDAERASFFISEDHRQSMHGLSYGCHFIKGTKTLLASDPHNRPKSLESAHCVGLSSHSDIQVKEISLNTPDSRFDPTGSLSFLRNLSPLLATSCSVIRKEENKKMQPQPPIETLTNSYLQILPSKDFCSNVGSKLVSNPVKNNCILDDFIGLPLNSQGELIHSQSGASFGFGEISRKQNVIQGSNRGYPVPHTAKPRTSLDHVNRMKGKFRNATLSQNVQPSWFQGQYSSGDLRNFADFGVQSNNETLTNKCRSFLCDHNFVDLYCHGCRDDTQNYIDRVNFQAERNMENVSQPNFQQTMRLMGTNVMVSENNKGCQSYGNGRIWIDKEVVTDHFGRILERPMQQQWVTHPSSMKPKNNLVHPLDTSTNFYSMPEIAPKLGLMHFNYRPQWVSRSDTHKANLFGHPLNMQSSMNDSSKSLLTSIPQITTVEIGHQIPALASNNTNSNQHMLLNSTHCKHSQDIIYSTTSKFHPPISYRETFSPSQSSTAQSSMNLPWWLLNAKRQRKRQRPPCSCYPDPLASFHQSSMYRADIFPLPSPHHTSTINFPFCARTTSKSGGLSIPSFVPSKTATDISGNNNMIRGGTSFNFTYLKSLDTAGKTRKRAAAIDDRFVKPAKKPFFRVQPEMTASADPRQEQMHINTMLAKAMTGSNNSEVCTENEGSRSLALSNFLEADGGLKPEPGKLTAGAKHVLKPCQNLNRDCSRSIHSTIPLSIGDNSGKVINSQMKATEIYRF